MPLVFAESEATAAGITYDDRTGVSYQFPKSYRRRIEAGEQFVYYRGRRTLGGGSTPQVYFGAGIVGATTPDPTRADRFTCEILDYRAFAAPVPFKDAGGKYLETGAGRRGYFQPGVRVISSADFSRIIAAAEVSELEVKEAGKAPAGEVERTFGPGYASPANLRDVEDFALRVANAEAQSRYPGAAVLPQPRNNPGFDILVMREKAAGEGVVFIEVKGTTRVSPQFFITEGELRFSRLHGDQYYLVVVYKIRRDAESYAVGWYGGPITSEGGFALKAVQWACQVPPPAFSTG